MNTVQLLLIIMSNDVDYYDYIVKYVWKLTVPLQINLTLPK